MRTYCKAQEMLYGDLNGKEIQKRDMCIFTADSLFCTAETQHHKATIFQ